MTQVSGQTSRIQDQVAFDAPGGSSEDELLRTYARTHDPAIRETLTRRFLGLARSLAARYRGGSEPFDDLVQVANLGLLKALNGFDPDRGRRFAAYAAPTILGELRRHFRDRVWDIRLPRGLQERTLSVRQVRRVLSHQLGRAPSPGEIAERMDVDEADVAEAMQAEEARRTLSLDAPRSREDAESVPMIETVGSSEGGYDRVESQHAAERAGLDPRERRVLRLRFEKHLTQSQIGDRIGVSQMQVSRIMRAALRKLLTAVRGHGRSFAGGPAG